MNQVIQKTIHFLKHAGLKVLLFLRSNWAYILWTALHMVIAYFALNSVMGDKNASLEYTFLIYGISILFALSPLGEWIVRSLERARPVKTVADKAYLLPLFDEVYEEARKKTPSLNKHIKLYISEEKSVNGFAMGRTTIALTRGAIESLNSEELKGILSHEFGHMANGDTKALLFTLIGNGFFSVIILGCRLLIRGMELIAILLSSGNNVAIIATNIIRFIAHGIFEYGIALFLFLGNIILAINSRFSENLADSYAYQIGYGEQLKNALILLNRMDMGGKQSLKEWLMASHPYTTARIARLEKKLELED